MTGNNRIEISGGNVQGFIQENYGAVNQYFISQVSELIGGQGASAEHPLSQAESRQRKVLISKVKEYWIEGVLEKSLHTKAMIELGLEKRPDLVERPFGGLEKLSKEARQILPAETNATEVFNQIGDGRTLLILGHPGAGKTITLLKLAHNLVTRTEENLSCLIPVIFNLSSWGSKQQLIESWLVEELWNKYQVPKEVGKSWIADQQLLLLLDGLDEVKANRRVACIEAINQFVQAYGQTEIVVCSRISDYKKLSKRLHLRGAIYIRSLTSDQVSQYLDSAGQQLGAVKTLLEEDPILRKLAKSPLILNIITLAYRGKGAAELPQAGSSEARRQHLFNTYIEQMFWKEKVGKSKEYQATYSDTNTKLWLTWLAQRMVQTSQSVFLIEQIQPNWLPNKNQRRLYFHGTIFFGVLAAFLTGLINVPNIGWNYALIMSLYGGLGIGTIYAINMFANKGEIKTTERLEWTWSSIIQNLRKGLLIGLGLGLVMGMITSFAEFNNYIEEYKVAIERLLNHEVNLLSLGLIYGLFITLTIGLIYGLTGDMQSFEITNKIVKPNQGIWRSAINTVKIGLIDGLVVFLIFWLIDVQLQGYPVVVALRYALCYGLIAGILFGLVTRSGRACIQHFTLRLILFSTGCVPWNYARFLDYASERVFLQKVGGGYIFVHRMLMEHFAGMER
jgi:GTPase SAR1 family protein